MRCVENIELMPGDTNEHPIRFFSTVPDLFVGPKLRCEDENIFKTSCQHARLRSHVEVVINLIFPIEIREPPSNRVRRIHEIKPYVPFVPFGFLFAIKPPGSPLNLFGPYILISADHTVMNNNQTPSLLQELLEICPLL